MTDGPWCEEVIRPVREVYERGRRDVFSMTDEEFAAYRQEVAVAVQEVWPTGKKWREVLAGPPPGCPFALHLYRLQPGETVIWAEVIDDGLALVIETETR